MTSSTFRPYDPTKPKRAPAIKDEVWDMHKPFILEMHDARNTRAQMIQRLRLEQSFSPSMSQLVARLKLWGCTVIEKPIAYQSTWTECAAKLDELEQKSKEPDPSTDLHLRHNSELWDWNELFGQQEWPYPYPSTTIEATQSASVEIKLSQALMIAERALWFDNNGHAQDAIEYYTASCRILEEVVQKYPDVGSYKTIAAISISKVIAWMQKQISHRMFSFSVQVPISKETLDSIAESVETDLPSPDPPPDESVVVDVPLHLIGGKDGIPTSELQAPIDQNISQDATHTGHHAEQCEAVVSDQQPAELRLQHDGQFSDNMQISDTASPVLAHSHTLSPASDTSNTPLPILAQASSSPPSSAPTPPTPLPIVAPTPPPYSPKALPIPHSTLQQPSSPPLLPPLPSLPPIVLQSLPTDTPTSFPTSSTPQTMPSSPLAATGSKPMSVCSSIPSERSSLRSLLRLAMRIRKGKTIKKISIESMSVKTSSTSSFHQVTGYDRMSIEWQS